MKHKLVFWRSFLQQLTFSEFLIILINNYELDFIVQKLWFDSEFVEHIDFLCEELDKIGVDLRMESIKPEILQYIDERADERFGDGSSADDSSKGTRNRGTFFGLSRQY